VLESDTQALLNSVTYNEEVFSVLKISLETIFLVGLFILPAFSAGAQPDDALTQVSTIDALLTGVYDGEMTLADLAVHGDFGIGTFNALDGEMILMDSTFYQVLHDGNVATPSVSTTQTPFAMAHFFEAGQTFSLSSGVTADDVKVEIDQHLPTKNIFYALKIHGTFASLEARSVPKQSKPYRPLADVVEDQSVFEFSDIEGTVIGFRSPPYSKGLNVPGYHFHFLSEDKQQGGHVLRFVTKQVVCEVDAISELSVLLPADEAFYSADLSRDQHAELTKVER